jgi:hypothetical protein
MGRRSPRTQEHEMPACAGMTVRGEGVTDLSSFPSVMPAQAGISHG